jgi:hypothetical protein
MYRYTVPLPRTPHVASTEVAVITWRPSRSLHPRFGRIPGLINNLIRIKREERSLPSLRLQLKTDSPKNDELTGQFLAKSATAMDLIRLDEEIVPHRLCNKSVSQSSVEDIFELTDY